MNCRGPLRGEGLGLRVKRWGITLLPTRDKSGRAFAPRDLKGDFQVSKRANLICGQGKDVKGKEKGVGNKWDH